MALSSGPGHIAIHFLSLSNATTTSCCCCCCCCQMTNSTNSEKLSVHSLGCHCPSSSPRPSPSLGCRRSYQPHPSPIALPLSLKPTKRFNDVAQLSAVLPLLLLLPLVLLQHLLLQATDRMTVWPQQQEASAKSHCSRPNRMQALQRLLHSSRRRPVGHLPFPSCQIPLPPPLADC